LANAFIYHLNTQTMHIKSIMHSSIAMISLKPNTLAGFEPRPSVLEADAMPTAPRRQGMVEDFLSKQLESSVVGSYLAQTCSIFSSLWSLQVHNSNVPISVTRLVKISPFQRLFLYV
jgi:hypothetical protein